MPTLPPASIDAPQSPGALTLAIGVPPGGPPEVPLESAWLHPALTNSPQSAAAPSTVRATRSMFMVRFSLKITVYVFLCPSAGFLSRRALLFSWRAPFGSPGAFSANGTRGKKVEPAPLRLLRALRLRRHHIPARPLV